MGNLNRRGTKKAKRGTRKFAQRGDFQGFAVQMKADLEPWFAPLWENL
jgi:hypothetical protein